MPSFVSTLEFRVEVLGPISWPSQDRLPLDWRDMVGIRVRSHWRKMDDATKMAVAEDAYHMFTAVLEKDGSF